MIRRHVRAAVALAALFASVLVAFRVPASEGGRMPAGLTFCALAARQWAVLLYDPYDDRWHDAAMDTDNDGVWVGANPLVVCDVAEHAFGPEGYRALANPAFVQAILSREPPRHSRLAVAAVRGLSANDEHTARAFNLIKKAQMV